MRVQPCYVCNKPSNVAIQTTLRAVQRGQSVWREYNTEILSLCGTCWQDLLVGKLSTDIVRIEDAPKYPVKTPLHTVG